MTQANIKTVAGRARLAPRSEPYWANIGRHCYVGYRPSKTGDRAGTWVARYRGDPSRPTKALGDFSDTPDARRYDAANAAAAEWFAHLMRGGSTKTHTVAEAVDEFVKHTGAEHGEDARKDVGGRLTRLVLADKKLASTELSKLTPGHINTWRKALLAPHEETGKVKAKSTVNRDMSALRATLNYAYKSGWVTSDHAWKNALLPIKNADNRRDVYLSSDERKKLVANCPLDMAPFIRCLCLLPLRPGVPAKMRAGDFDPKQGTLKVGNDKANTGRGIGLPTALVEFFTEQAKDKLPTAYMFTRADGVAWNRHMWKDGVKAAAQAAGLPEKTVLYSLRHSTITDLITGGLDVMTVSRLSGTSIAMIQKHYGHLTEARAREALAILAA